MLEYIEGVAELTFEQGAIQDWRGADNRFAEYDRMKGVNRIGWLHRLPMMVNNFCPLFTPH